MKKLFVAGRDGVRELREGAVDKGNCAILLTALPEFFRRSFKLRHTKVSKTRHVAEELLFWFPVSVFLHFPKFSWKSWRREGVSRGHVGVCFE